MANLSLNSCQRADRELALEEERRGFAVHAVITTRICPGGPGVEPVRTLWSPSSAFIRPLKPRPRKEPNMTFVESRRASPRAGAALPGLTLQVDHVTKRYGGTTVVEDLAFTAEPGRVTGFPGRTARESRRR